MNIQNNVSANCPVRSKHDAILPGNLHNINGILLLMTLCGAKEEQLALVSKFIKVTK